MKNVVDQLRNRKMNNKIPKDYSDLIKTINWCQTHREQCQTFGINARNLFDKVATPSVYWEYIKRILDAK